MYFIKEYIFSFAFFRKIILYKIKRYSKLSAFKKLKLNTESIFIDLGGNNGVVSQYISDKFNCNIHIYEPHKGCFKILKKKFNNNKKIKVYNSAISNNNNYKKFYFHSNVKDNNFYDLSLSESASLESKKINISKKKFEIVKCIGINNIVKKFKHIDVLKIDIEGHEYKILPTIYKNIKKVDYVFIEFHGRSHHQNFKKKYNYWKKKINKSIYKKKFINW
jgi:FkbM family methyltransferase